MSASPVAFGAPKAPAGRKRKLPAAAPHPPPHPAHAGLALLAAGAGLGATLAVTITSEPSSQLSVRGGLLTFAGSLTGMIGTYLALIMVLLVSRIPFMERVAGQDGLLRLHRAVAPWPISLLAAHALLLTLGYAEAARAGAWHEVGVLLTRYPDVLTATIGLGLMCLIGIVSVHAVRRQAAAGRPGG